VREGWRVGRSKIGSVIDWPNQPLQAMAKKQAALGGAAVFAEKVFSGNQTNMRWR